MVVLAHIVPALSLILASSALPTDDYSYYGSGSGASNQVAPAPAGAPAAASSVDPNAYDVNKQHSILWNSWAPSATAAAAVAPAQHTGGSMAVDVKYGSGSMAAVTDLNSCLQMCQASFGAPAHSATPPAHTSGAAAPLPPPSAAAAPPANNGASVTHTIIVAPTQGVLRFVPFSVNAKQGDMLEFIWGAGPHSATLSQGQNVCNKSMTAEAFDSGKLNATAKYMVKVNATTPTFHYCTVGTHCTAGMFGIVNPPTTSVTTNLTATRTTAAGAGSTAGSGSSGCNGDRMDCWVATWGASSPEASATVSAVKKACEGSEAWKWGGGMDMSGMLGPEVTKVNAIENVMYTRLMMAMNPAMIAPGGGVAATLPSNWTAAPDLKSFVALSDSTGSSSVAAAGSSPAASGAETSASPSDGVVDSAAAAANSTSGASRMMAPVLALAVLAGGMAVLL
ncbi:uncharacterized protein MKK02DRAFT_31381 [Dioszegia hungarica]|uniref:Blue (type 1) copper domain-containing protein n=1 Tax=Dioszegia hungarica TaxID=4972 RepID=A0AA38HCQ5_9TREE|nr:uncharacterized protein MKK02DRAFT_31381 [Dioszegia hungarica]KAI9637821.1 hypothetical protein MKK02DRAFT_31381 [Dioszegia hungarica]